MDRLGAWDREAACSGTLRKVGVWAREGWHWSSNWVTMTTRGGLAQEGRESKLITTPPFQEQAEGTALETQESRLGRSRDTKCKEHLWSVPSQGSMCRLGAAENQGSPGAGRGGWLWSGQERQCPRAALLP